MIVDYLKTLTFLTNLVFAIIFYWIMPKFNKDQQSLMQIAFCTSLAILCVADFFFLETSILWLILAIYWIGRTIYHVYKLNQSELKPFEQPNKIYLSHHENYNPVLNMSNPYFVEWLEPLTPEIIKEIFNLNEIDFENFKTGKEIEVNLKEKQMLQYYYTKHALGIINANLTDYKYFIHVGF